MSDVKKIPVFTKNIGYKGLNQWLKSRSFGYDAGRLVLKFLRAGPTWAENTNGPGRTVSKFRAKENFERIEN